MSKGTQRTRAEREERSQQLIHTQGDGLQMEHLGRPLVGLNLALKMRSIHNGQVMIEEEACAVETV